MGIIQSILRQRDLQERARQRREVRNDIHYKYNLDTLPPPVSSTLEVQILAGSISELQRMMNDNVCTSEEIVATYIRRSYHLGFHLGGITEELYSTAILEARESDKRRKAAVLDVTTTGTTLGPLEGIPISVKDMFHVKNTDSTCGLACKAFSTLQSTDGIYASLLRQAGGILVCKSNIPQSLMVPESDNYIFGKTVNAYDATRTCGGSSGGEALLVSTRCSVVGLGTDIGGSIRIPASFCGTYGFKPTPERLSQYGMEAPRPFGYDGQNGVLVSTGPFGRCTEDCTTVMKALLVPELYRMDPTVPRIPFSNEKYTSTKKLRIAYYLTDDFWEPAVACKRGVLQAAELLRRAGHEVIEINLRSHGISTYRAALLYYGLLGSDGKLREFKRGLEGEQLHPLYATLNTLASLPDYGIRPLLSSLLRLLGYTRMGDLLSIARSRRTDAYWQLVAERNMMKTKLIKVLQDQQIDLLLTPALGLPAFKHGGSADLTVICSYTFIWNLFHFPAGVVPVTRVRKGPEEESYTCPSNQNDMFAQKAKAMMEGTAGLPINVQLVGLPFEEETVLRGMKELENLLQEEIQKRNGRGTENSPRTGSNVNNNVSLSTTKDSVIDNPSSVIMNDDIIQPYVPDEIIQQTLRELHRSKEGTMYTKNPHANK